MRQFEQRKNTGETEVCQYNEWARMSARLALALVLAAGGIGVLMAHPALYPRLWTYGLVVVLVGCASLGAVWWTGDRVWPLTRAVSIALAALAAAALLSVGVNVGAGWSGLWRPVVQWGLLGVGAWLAADGKALRLLGIALLSGGAVAGGYAILQYYHLDPLPAVTPFGALRIVSFFENPNFLGNFAAAALPLALVAFLHAESLIGRAVLALGACLVYAGMLLAGSRGGWMAGLAGGLIVVIGTIRGVGRGRIRLHWPSLVALVALLVATTLLLSQRPVVESRSGAVTMAERMLSTRHIIEPYVESEAPSVGADSVVVAPQIEVRDFTVNHRYFIWEVTWDMIRARPLVGFGYGTYQQRFAAFRDARRDQAHFQSLVWTQQEEDTPYAHNEYLHLWAESGLLGLGAFLALVGWVGWGTLRMAWREGTPYAWAGLGMVAAMLVHSLVSYPLRLPLNGMVFWLTLGILVGLVKLRNSK